MKHLVLAALLLVSAPAGAGTIYVDCDGSVCPGSNGASALNSGSTDTTSFTFSGSAAAWTTATTTINLDTNTNLTGVITTPGPTHSSINLVNATNTNSRTIFWVMSVTGCTGTGACSITVDTAVSCTTCSGNGWRIGGRYLWPAGSTVNAVDAAIGLSTANDILQFNTTPAIKSTIFYTARNSGSSAIGMPTIQGKPGGPRPKLQTNTVNISIINLNNVFDWKITGLEFATTTTGTGDTVVNSGTGTWFDNNLVSSCVVGVNLAQVMRVTNNEVTNCSGDGLLGNSAGMAFVSGNYIHNNSGNGINASVSSGPNYVIMNNLIVNNTGRGIYQSGVLVTAQSHGMVIEGNTIANNTGVQFETADPDFVSNFRNNIFANTTSTNIVKWVAGGNAEVFGNHGYNVFYSSGGGTLVGVTANATEVCCTTAPGFINSAGGNWAISSTGPAAGTGFPGTLQGNSSVGYRDIGAFQRQAVPGGGGGRIIGG